MCSSDLVLLDASQSSNVRTGIPVCCENSFLVIPTLSLSCFIVSAIVIIYPLSMHFYYYNIVLYAMRCFVVCFISITYFSFNFEHLFCAMIPSCCNINQLPAVLSKSAPHSQRYFRCPNKVPVFPCLQNTPENGTLCADRKSVV